VNQLLKNFDYRGGSQSSARRMYKMSAEKLCGLKTTSVDRRWWQNLSGEKVLIHYEITPTHSMLGLKNGSGCVQVPHLHTVIEILDKNRSNFQM